ncbi:MAG: Flp family type IVb pilin [Geminicoccaceae bacterium]
MIQLFDRFLRAEEASTLIEYALLGSLTAIGLFVTLGDLGSNALWDLLVQIETALVNAEP